MNELSIRGRFKRLATTLVCILAVLGVLVIVVLSCYSRRVKTARKVLRSGGEYLAALAELDRRARSILGTEREERKRLEGRGTERETGGGREETTGDSVRGARGKSLRQVPKALEDFEGRVSGCCARLERKACGNLIDLDSYARELKLKIQEMKRVVEQILTENVSWLGELSEEKRSAIKLAAASLQNVTGKVLHEAARVFVKKSKDAETPAGVAKWTAIGITFLLFILSLGLARIVLRRVVSDVVPQMSRVKFAVSEATQRLALASRQLVIHAHDLDTQVVAVAAASQNVLEQVRQMAASAEQANLSTKSAATATDEVAANMGESERSVSVISGTLDDLASAAQEMSSSVDAAAVGAEEMSASLVNVARDAEKAARAASEAEESVKRTSTTVNVLGSSASEIGEVVEVIKGIAAQTNLLALNATIEAAGAGEAGKGFAVVANEIKELARQTAGATEEVRRRIEEIQSRTNASVESISAISGVIGEINATVGGIASSVEEQTATTYEISKSVSNAASAAREVAKNVQNASENAGEVTQRVRESVSAAQEISAGTLSAANAASEISQVAAEVASSMKEVTSGIGGIDERIHKFKENFNFLSQASQDMAKLVVRTERIVEGGTGG